MPAPSAITKPSRSLSNGPAGPGRLVFAAAHRLHVLEPRQRHRHDGCLAPARDHDVRPAPADQLGGLAEGMAARRAGRGERQVGPAGAEQDADLRGGAVEHERGHRKRAHAARPALQQRQLVLEDRVHAADPRSDNHADPLGVPVGRVQAGIGHRFLARRHGEMQEPVHAPRDLPVHVMGRVEVLHLGGDRRLEGRGVELRDRADAGLATDDGSPGGGNVVPNGGDQPEAGDDHALRYLVGSREPPQSKSSRASPCAGGWGSRGISQNHCY